MWSRHADPRPLQYFFDKLQYIRHVFGRLSGNHVLYCGRVPQNIINSRSNVLFRLSDNHANLKWSDPYTLNLSSRKNLTLCPNTPSFKYLLRDSVIRLLLPRYRFAPKQASGLFKQSSVPISPPNMSKALA